MNISLLLKLGLISMYVCKSCLRNIQSISNDSFINLSIYVIYLIFIYLFNKIRNEKTLVLVKQYRPKLNMI